VLQTPINCGSRIAKCVKKGGRNNEETGKSLVVGWMWNVFSFIFLVKSKEDGSMHGKKRGSGNSFGGVRKRTLEGGKRESGSGR